ncbi:MAG: hypothetical protein AAF633_18515 [Chloroflexota bacterium]
MKAQAQQKVIKLNSLLVAEWEAWNGFLISALVEETCRQHTVIDTPPDHIELSFDRIHAFLWQINLSESKFFPKARIEIEQRLESQGIAILNKGFTDITKHSLQDLLVNYQLLSTRLNVPTAKNNLVIVKSTLNWGGELEARLTAEQQAEYGISQFVGPIQGHADYLILHESDVPDIVWETETLIVERFILNDEDSFYRAYCAGSAVVLVKAHAPEPIKKIAGDPRDTNDLLRFDGQTLCGNTAHLPSKLITMIEAFMELSQLDFFCLDIVHDDDSFYIVDLNLTPWLGEALPTPKILEFMVKGLRDKYPKLV